MSANTERHSFLSSLTVKHWFSIGLAVLAIAFIVQNRAVIAIDVFFVSIRLPLWVSLSLVFVAGWVSGRFWRPRKAAAR
jgi:uncharacterized integral membrane protein